MKTVFKELATYIHLHDGCGKPKIDFQDLYKLFPQFTFTACNNFGSYSNFGKAYEAKCYDMIISDGKNECFMIYKVYGDANENLAYISQ